MTRFFVAGAMLAAMCGPQQPGHGGNDPRDVTGNYAITYDNQLKLKLNIGGAVREVTQSGYGGVTDFGTYNGQPVTIRLEDFCAKPEVKCPSEQFWAKVAIDQPQLDNNGFDLQELRVVDDTTHTLPAGQQAASLSGLVNHAYQDRFLLGLGAQAGATQGCAAIDVSLAGGRFSHAGEKMETTMEYRDQHGRACSPDAGTALPDAGPTADAGASADAGAGPDAGEPIVCALTPITRLTYPPGAAVDGIKEGDVGLWWAGGCAFGPFLVGATFSIETGYTATRTGNYDPPPFTPAPVVLPDGGDLDGGAADGG